MAFPHPVYYSTPPTNPNNVHITPHYSPHQVQHGRVFLSRDGYYTNGNTIQQFPCQPPLYQNAPLQHHQQIVQYYTQPMSQTRKLTDLGSSLGSHEKVSPQNQPETLKEHCQTPVQRTNQIIIGPGPLMTNLANQQHPPTPLMQPKQPYQFRVVRMAYCLPPQRKPSDPTGLPSTNAPIPQPTPRRNLQPTQAVYYNEAGQIIRNPRIPELVQQPSSIPQPQYAQRAMVQLPYLMEHQNNGHQVTNNFNPSNARPLQILHSQQQNCMRVPMDNRQFQYSGYQQGHYQSTPNAQIPTPQIQPPQGLPIQRLIYSCYSNVMTRAPQYNGITITTPATCQHSQNISVHQLKPSNNQATSTSQTLPPSSQSQPKPQMTTTKIQPAQPSFDSNTTKEVEKKTKHSVMTQTDPMLTSPVAPMKHPKTVPSQQQEREDNSAPIAISPKGPTPSNTANITSSRVSENLQAENNRRKTPQLATGRRNRRQQETSVGVAKEHKRRHLQTVGGSGIGLSQESSSNYTQASRSNPAQATTYVKSSEVPCQRNPETFLFEEDFPTLSASMTMPSTKKSVSQISNQISLPQNVKGESDSNSSTKQFIHQRVPFNRNKASNLETYFVTSKSKREYASGIKKSNSKVEVNIECKRVPPEKKEEEKEVEKVFVSLATEKVEKTITAKNDPTCSAMSMPMTDDKTTSVSLKNQFLPFLDESVEQKSSDSTEFTNENCTVLSCSKESEFSTTAKEEAANALNDKSLSEAKEKTAKKKKKKQKGNNDNALEEEESVFEEQNRMILEQKEYIIAMRENMCDYYESFRNVRRTHLAFWKQQPPLHPLQYEITEFFRERLCGTMNFETTQAKMLQALKPRIKAYENSGNDESRKLLYLWKFMKSELEEDFMEDTIIQDIMFLLDKKRSEYDQNALEKQYLDMIYTYHEWANTPPSDLVLEDVQCYANLIDIQYLQHFVDHVNIHCYWKNPSDSDKATPPTLDVNRHLFYKEVEHRNINWSSRQSKEFLTKKKDSLLEKRDKSQTDECFIKFYDFLLKVKSSIIDFDTYWYHFCAHSKNESNEKCIMKNNNLFFRMIFGGCEDNRQI